MMLTEDELPEPDIAQHLLDAFGEESIALVTPAGSITRINARWSKHCADNGGDPLRCGTGENYFEVCRRVRGPERTDALRFLAAAARLFGGQTRHEDFVYRCATPTATRWCRAILSIVHAPEPLLLVRHQDITAEELGQQELIVARDALQKAETVRDELLDLVSHELRTPVTVVRGNASALARRGEGLSRAERRQALLDLERDAVRLQQVVENLLVLARREEISSEQQEPVDLGHVVRRAVQELQLQYPDRPVEVLRPGDSPVVLGAERQLKQILVNLLSNAAKYSPATSPIAVSLERAGADARVSVSDKGIGVMEDEAPHVFEPFYRSPRAMEVASGMGLGLTACKLLVDQHQGLIEPTRVGTDGATFTLSLPLAVA
jgi:signal transduction histidine kinase